MTTRPGSKIDPEVEQMFERFRFEYPHRYRDDAWYLTMASALIAIGSPSLVGPLFTYTTKANPNQPPTTISNRLRETLLKIFTITGIAPVIGAVIALAAAERSAGLNPPSSASETGDSKGLETQVTHNYGPPHTDRYERGDAFLRLIYKHNLEPIVEQMGRHGPEIMTMERHVIYGMYLSDFQIMNERETELVVFPAMLCGGTQGAAEWHIRGGRRTGLEWEEIRGVVRALIGFANWILGGEEVVARGSRLEIVPGKGRSEWLDWVEGLQKGMEEDGH